MSARVSLRERRVVQCCSCRRVHENGAWSSQVDLREFDISHGYCPDCYTEALDRLTSQDAERRATMATALA